MASLARRPCFAPLGLPVAWTDLKRLKGFVEEAAEGLLSRLTQMMLVAGRIIQPLSARG